MRKLLDKPRLQRLMRELGRASTGPGRVYLCGGATALLAGWRASTVDVDLQFDPEPAGIFTAIATLKNTLDINIELAGPSDFVPPLPGWRDRCVPIGDESGVEFLHYDPYTQALSKLQRGHGRDLADVRAMVDNGWVDLSQFCALFDEARPLFIRYPGVDVGDLACRVTEFVDAIR